MAKAAWNRFCHYENTGWKTNSVVLWFSFGSHHVKNLVMATSVFFGETWSNNSLSIARVELCHIILEDQMAHQSPIRCTKRCPSHCCWWYHHCWWLTLFWAWNHMVYTLFCCCSNWFVSSCFLFGTLAFSMPAQGCCSHLGRPRPTRSRSLKRKRRSQRRNRRRNQRRYPQMSLGRGIELAVSTYQWKIGISFTKRGV